MGKDSDGLQATGDDSMEACTLCAWVRALACACVCMGWCPCMCVCMFMCMCVCVCVCVCVCMHSITAISGPTVSHSSAAGVSNPHPHSGHEERINKGLEGH